MATYDVSWDYSSPGKNTVKVLAGSNPPFSVYVNDRLVTSVNVNNPTYVSVNSPIVIRKVEGSTKTFYSNIDKKTHSGNTYTIPGEVPSNKLVEVFDGYYITITILDK